MAMKNPVHLGVIVREDCMRPLNLSVTECAKMLGVARQTLSSHVKALLECFWTLVDQCALLKIYI